MEPLENLLRNEKFSLQNQKWDFSQINFFFSYTIYGSVQEFKHTQGAAG